MTALDGARSYALAIAIAREKGVRDHSRQPRPNDSQEQRWAREGTIPDRDLDTVRSPE